MLSCKGFERTCVGWLLYIQRYSSRWSY